jgi:hypothetical protein
LLSDTKMHGEHNVKFPNSLFISHYLNTKSNKNLFSSFEYKSNCREKNRWAIRPEFQIRSPSDDKNAYIRIYKDNDLY